MASKIPSVYWDSCIFIDGHQKTDGRYPHIQRVEADAKMGLYRIATSSLAVAEVVKLPELDLLPEEDERQIREYFDNKFVTILPIDRPVARHAAAIVREHGLKPPDAVHLAAAIRFRSKALLTYDRNSGLLNLDRMVDGFRIQTPDDYGDPDLYSTQ